MPGEGGGRRCYGDEVHLRVHASELRVTAPPAVVFGSFSFSFFSPALLQMVELGKEVENGRLLRLLAKINFVVERPAGEGAGMGAGADGVRQAAGRDGAAGRST